MSRTAQTLEVPSDAANLFRNAVEPGWPEAGPRAPRSDGQRGQGPPAEGSAAADSERFPGRETRIRSAALDLSDLGLIDELRRLLEQHQYSEAGLRRILGPEDGRMSVRSDGPYFLKRAAEPTPSNTLAKLFALHAVVTADAARAAFTPLALDALVSLGLLEIGPEGVQARLAISVFGDLWLAHDFADGRGQALAADHVLGVSPATLTLAKLTVRNRVDQALDLGAGCGVQGLSVARQCRRVIAVDTNPRALNLTLFNARLNRLTNVECRLGNCFDPVAGLRFDLIVCNPPYVISPESHYQFRDSGLPGDRICEQVVRAAPTYLTRGGLACVLCSWAHKKDELWHQRLRGWVAGRACDALLFHGATQDPLGYAAAWTRNEDPREYRQALDRWNDYYRELGIEALSVGAVILRRRPAARNWVWTECLPRTLTDSCSDQVLRLIAAQDHLERHPTDESLLAQVYRGVDGMAATRVQVNRRGRLELETIRLESRSGLRLQGAVDESTLELLTRCDGKRSFGEAARDLARSVKADEAETCRRAAALLRQLVACGFLAPVDSAGTSDPGSPGGEPGTDVPTTLPPGVDPGSRKENSL